jgi:hypothetical protein
MQFRKGHIPWIKSKHLAEETRHKISIAKKRYHENGGKNWNEGRLLSEERKYRIRQSKKRASVRKSKSLLKHYQEHEVWNKDRPWSLEVRDRIREGCLNSEIGMGPKVEEVVVEGQEI